MAHKATIFKAELSIADMDRHYYHDHTLTIAWHPSETNELFDHYRYPALRQGSWQSILR